MSDPHVIGLGALVVLFVLLALRMPVALAMVLVGVGGNWALSQALPYLRFEPYLAQFKTLLWSNVANYDLSVV
ncbi:MAG: C4-dicarboxylate ABC transporter permease, partial [Pseudomonadota bacterium]